MCIVMRVLSYVLSQFASCSVHDLVHAGPANYEVAIASATATDLSLLSTPVPQARSYYLNTVPRTYWITFSKASKWTLVGAAQYAAKAPTGAAMSGRTHCAMCRRLPIPDLYASMSAILSPSRAARNSPYTAGVNGVTQLSPSTPNA
jgi:hypothetical protein